MGRKALKCLLAGLLGDLGLLVAALLPAVAFALLTYDGQCGLGIMFGGRQPCGPFSHVYETLLLAGSVIPVSGWRVYAVMLLALPPVAGFLLGLWRRSPRPGP